MIPTQQTIKTRFEKNYNELLEDDTAGSVFACSVTSRHYHVFKELEETPTEVKRVHSVPI